MTELGIKETEEVVIAANEVTVFIVKTFSDGIDLKDFNAIWEKLTEDKVFRELLERAYQDYEKIPAEMADLDFDEGLKLAGIQLEYIPKIIAAMKRKKK